MMQMTALLAIVFASLAPTISHVLASQHNSNRLIQAICTSTGQTFTIEVLTSKGNTVKTALDWEPVSQEHEAIAHLQHCPFCYAGAMDAVLPAHSPTFVLFLAQQAALQTSSYPSAFIRQIAYQTPLKRGPPKSQKQT